MPLIALQYILVDLPQLLYLLQLTIPILLNLAFTRHTNKFAAIFAQLINVVQLIHPEIRATQIFPCARELRFREVAYNMSLICEE
jgi:hypothetical protein